MASTQAPPQMQGLTASYTERESRTASSDGRSFQPDGRGVEGSESSGNSFVSAQASIESSGTHQAVMLLIHKIAQLEKSTHEITLERDELQKESVTSRRHLEAARRNSATLERQVKDLLLKVSEGAQDLKREVAELAAKVQYHESGRAQTYQNGVMDGMRSQSSANERAILLQQVEAYKAEAAKWRMEAFRHGSEAISRCWQASVDEAVRREREIDALVMRALRDELAALKPKRES